jgi:hypothetical protein
MEGIVLNLEEDNVGVVLYSHQPESKKVLLPKEHNVLLR